MIRMEIALILLIAFVAYMYFRAQKKHTKLHQIFSVLLISTIVHLFLDAATLYTVNHLEDIPMFVNDILHRLFIGSMLFVIYLFYKYIATLVAEETNRVWKFDMVALVFFVITEIACLLLPIEYVVTDNGNYSYGPCAFICYAGVAVYLFLCIGLLIFNWKRIDKKEMSAISITLIIELTVCVIQALQPTWLISGMGISLMTLSFYFILENPDILRAELTEQKMSMLYLKSQVNPHFLYNTLDTIRIQAQLNDDKQVADLLMNLSDFFRLSVKVDKPEVTLEDEMELLEAYMELMCYRYPEIKCEYDLDMDLYNAIVPNFILQPIVENSLLHGLKNKGYRGQLFITAKKKDNHIQISVKDSGSGFDEEKKAAIDEILLNYDKQPAKLTGNSIGVLNVQKRIKLLCGREYGLSYTDNELGGVTAHITLPLKEK